MFGTKLTLALRVRVVTTWNTRRIVCTELGKAAQSEEHCDVDWRRCASRLPLKVAGGAWRSLRAEYGRATALWQLAASLFLMNLESNRPCRSKSTLTNLLLISTIIQTFQISFFTPLLLATVSSSHAYLPNTTFLHASCSAICG